MTKQHTPSPYHIEQRSVMDLRICSAADVTLAIVSRFPMSADESLYTAMLFAAAPHLLEACEAAHAILTGDPVEVSDYDRSVAVITLEHAIAAAKGAPIEASQAGGQLPDGVALLAAMENLVHSVLPADRCVAHANARAVIAKAKGETVPGPTT